jgi:hypothetical protein
LSSASSASLTFHLWGITPGQEGCPGDFLYMGSSTDGTSFLGTRYCGNWTNGNNGNGYHRAVVDLANRLGQSQVWIAFHFYSDSSVTNAGFAIDDMTLSVTPHQSTVQHMIYLPAIARNWSPPPPTATPVPGPADPCLVVFGEETPSSPPPFVVGCAPTSGRPPVEAWRRDPRSGAYIGFDTTFKDNQGGILYSCSIDIQRRADGRLLSYSGTCNGKDMTAFNQSVTNRYDRYGGLLGANAAKTHADGYSYQLEITRYCPTARDATGYAVKVFAPPYNGEEAPRGTCR